jgi:hypothetical protein
MNLTLLQFDPLLAFITARTILLPLLVLSPL